MRIVEAADDARRQIERDLHDGAQQRFVSASLLLSLARLRIGDDGEALAQLLAQIAGELEAGLADLRELAHGIHPTVLTDHGLRAAVDGLAARSRVPVEVEGELHVRPAPPDVTIVQAEHHAEVEIRDDGYGGAEPLNGSGLRGLVDRLGALGGHLHVDSPRGGGTTVRAIVPLDPRDVASEPSCGRCAEGQCRCAA